MLLNFFPVGANTEGFNYRKPDIKGEKFEYKSSRVL